MFNTFLAEADDLGFTLRRRSDDVYTRDAVSFDLGGELIGARRGQSDDSGAAIDRHPHARALPERLLEVHVVRVVVRASHARTVPPPATP